LQIGTYMLLIITSTGDRLFKFINIDDLEWPWTFPKGVFSEFFAIFKCCDEMAGVRPRQPAYEIFSIKRRFQQSKSRFPRFMQPGAGGRQRRLPLLKKWLSILPQLSGVAWKRLQIGTDMLFIINFCDLLLQHKIQEWTATKRLETDWQFAKRNCYRLSRVSWALAQISCLCFL